MKRRDLLAFWIGIGSGLGCAPGLEVRAVSVATPATVVTACEDPQSDDCASLRSPRYAIDLGGSSTIGWARLSSDGQLLVLSSMRHEKDSSRSSIVGIDLALKSEIWRVSLSDDPSIAAEDALVLPSAVLLAVPESKGALTIVALDRHSGRELWRRARTSSSAPHRIAYGGTTFATDVVHALGADPNHDLVITAESSHVQILDAKTGTAAVSADLRGADDLSLPRIRSSAAAAYVVDQGLTRIPRGTSGRTWYQPFATHALHVQRPLLGSSAAFAAGFAVLSMLASGGRIMIAPGFNVSDRTRYELGRTSDPIEIDGLACVAAFGVVSCFDQASGALRWSRKFPVTQFRRLVARPNVLCVLGGGLFVRVESDTVVQAESPYRGLYCVRTSDGAPLPGFAAPLTNNRPGVILSETDLAGYDPDGDDQSLEDHGMPPGEKSPRIADIAATESGILAAEDGEVFLLTLPAGTIASRTDISDLGAVRHLTAVGGVIVANLGRGFAGFDAITGNLLWKRFLRQGVLPPIRSIDGNRPTVAPPTSGLIGADYPLTMPRADMSTRYWLLPRSRTIVAADNDGQIVGIAVDDGTIGWRLPGVDQLVASGPGRSWIVTVRGAEIDAYTPPLLAGDATTDRGLDRAIRELEAMRARTSYIAPPGCPSQEAFERLALKQGTVARHAAPNGRGQRFRIRIVTSGPDVRGTLEIGGVEGAFARREITGKRCDEVTAALALMVAMAVDPQMIDAPRPASPTPSQAEPTPPSPDDVIDPTP